MNLLNAVRIGLKRGVIIVQDKFRRGRPKGTEWMELLQRNEQQIREAYYFYGWSTNEIAKHFQMETYKIERFFAEKNIRRSQRENRTYKKEFFPIWGE